MSYLLRLLLLPLRFIQILIYTIFTAFAYYATRFSSNLFSNPTPAPEKWLRHYLENLGGTFVKMGQGLAMRPDFLPLSYCEELSKLLDEVPPFKTSKAKEIIEKELGAKLNELFIHFEDEPIGAASFGQVHYAVTKDENPVAIKVLRPHIEVLIEVDILFLKFFTFIAALSPAIESAGISPIMKEIIAILRLELDYNVEAETLRACYAQSKEIPKLVVPKVFDEYSTRKVLTMDHLEGVWLKDIISYTRSNPQQACFSINDIEINRDEVYQAIFIIGMRTMFEHGLFHGDPHAGNLLVMKNGNIGYIDFGIAGYIETDQRMKQLEYFAFIASGNISGAIDVFTTYLIQGPDADMTGCKRSLYPIMRYWVYITTDGSTNFREKSTAQLLMKCAKIAKQYGFRLPYYMLVYNRALLIIESILYELDPVADIKKDLGLYVSDFLKNSLEKSVSGEGQQLTLLKYFEAFRDLPDTILSIQRLTNELDPAISTFSKKISSAYHLGGEFVMGSAIALTVSKYYFATDIARLILPSFSGSTNWIYALIFLLGIRLYSNR